MYNLGASLVVQKLKNLPCNAGDMGSIPDQGNKNLPAAEQLSQNATA